MSTLYHYTVAAISENGHINADRFNVICDSPLVSLISKSMAKLIFDLTVLERDALFVNLGLGIEIKKSVIEIDPTTINESGVPELRAIFDSMA